MNVSLSTNQKLPQDNFLVNKENPILNKESPKLNKETKNINEKKPASETNNVTQAIILADLSVSKNVIGKLTDDSTLTKPQPIVLNNDQKDKLINILQNKVSTVDLQNISQAIDSASAIVGSHFTSAITNSKKAAVITSTNDLSSKEEPLLQNESNATKPVAGGTDITATNDSQSFFANFKLGNEAIMNTIISLLSVLNNLTNISAESATAWSKVTVDSAIAEGQKGINAASENLGGSITGGIVGLGIQVGSAINYTGKLRNESTSIKENLVPANEMHTTGMQQESILSAQEDLTNLDMLENKKMLAETSRNARQHELNHKDIEIKTQKGHIKHDTHSAISKVSNEVIVRGFEVGASEQQKEAIESKANQSVTSSVDNQYQESAKKAHESETSLREVLLGILNNRNDAVSYISTHIA